MDRTDKILDGLRKPAWKVGCSDCATLREENDKLHADRKMKHQHISKLMNEIKGLKQREKRLRSTLEKIEERMRQEPNYEKVIIALLREMAGEK